MFKRLSIWIGFFAVIIAGLLLATQYFIQPMNTDLSVVGQDKPALVLAYENYSPDSGMALNLLNSIKKDYQHLMSFAVADLGTPQGASFANRYRLTNGAAIFLSAEGEPLRVTILTSNEQDLRALLDEKLALVGIVK